MRYFAGVNDWLASFPLWVVFFAVGVVLLALEMTTLTFDLLWLGVGALSGALVAWLLPTAPAWIPTMVSVGVGLGLLIVGRRWARRQRGTARYVDPTDALVGQVGEVVRAIRPPGLGLVRVGTATWSATADRVVEAGQRVIIKDRSSTIVVVGPTD